MIGINATLKLDGLEQYAAGLEKRLSEAVRKTAFDIEASAKTDAPIDFGFLANSIYTSTHAPVGKSNYASARAAAQARNPDATMLPEHKAPDGLAAVVAVGAEYGIYVDYGTVRMAPQPYFTPAVEKAREPFKQALTQALKDGA